MEDRQPHQFSSTVSTSCWNDSFCRKLPVHMRQHLWTWACCQTEFLGCINIFSHQPLLHGPWLWRLMAHLLFYPKLESLSSASSPRVPKTLPHLPLTPMPEREVEGVRQGETSSAKSRSVNVAWPNETKVVPDPTVLSSSQSMPVANESGASTQPCQTPDSLLNHGLWIPPVLTQLTEWL